VSKGGSGLGCLALAVIVFCGMCGKGSAPSAPETDTPTYGHDLTPSEDRSPANSEPLPGAASESPQTPSTMALDRSWSSSAGIADEPAHTEEKTVYVTDTGSKYHSGGCRYLRRSSNSMPLSQARMAYSPCSVCRG